ncbi:hypothetical protein LR48_Vigan641s003800 [Vigna angularis]|uniref:Uncharacterized protein n=1 Tax=Phaseolus angularis TaxID=3914 RepID=A0A0L9TF58_PHAAN|nr:hypothetical protein LR48_Vigan641s003800 [Vigna angularis]
MITRRQQPHHILIFPLSKANGTFNILVQMNGNGTTTTCLCYRDWENWDFVKDFLLDPFTLYTSCVVPALCIVSSDNMPEEDSALCIVSSNDMPQEDYAVEHCHCHSRTNYANNGDNKRGDIGVHYRGFVIGSS